MCCTVYTVHIDVHKQFYTSVCWMCSSTQLEYNKSVFIAMPILMPTQRWEMRWCLHYVALAHKCVMFFLHVHSAFSAINHQENSFSIRLFALRLCVCVFIEYFLFLSFLLLFWELMLYTEEKCIFTDIYLYPNSFMNHVKSIDDDPSVPCTVCVCVSYTCRTRIGIQTWWKTFCVSINKTMSADIDSQTDT